MLFYTCRKYVFILLKNSPIIVLYYEFGDLNKPAFPNRCTDSLHYIYKKTAVM